MASFQEDEELEDKLKQDPRELDEDELQEVQVYKSQKLQALRDSGESGDRPDWWASDHAPETMGDLAATISGDGSEAAPEGDEGSEETEETEEAEEAPEEDASEEPETEDEEDSDEGADDVQEEGGQPEPEPEPTPQPAAASGEGVPQVGWSKSVPETEDVDFESELMEGVYRRQDELMQQVQALRAEVGDLELGGEALESLQGTLEGLVETVNALQENPSDEDLRNKVDEIYALLARSRDAEAKLSELPPLPSEEELVAAGILDGPVEHDTSDNCFHTAVDNRKAALHYGPGEDRLVVYHYNLPTIFSESLRHTVEDVLARALFEHAREEDKLVHPQQAQVRGGFLARHPEYRELTTQGRERGPR